METDGFHGRLEARPTNSKSKCPFGHRGQRMNEAAWDACEDPRKLLEWVRRRASDRKFRLFACAYWKWDEETIQPEPGMASALKFAETWAETGTRPDGYPGGFRGWHPLL